jgi:hypothetical protein
MELIKVNGKVALSLRYESQGIAQISNLGIVIG